MSHTRREATRSCAARPRGRPGWHQAQGHPLGVTMEVAMRDGGPVESVVDPDMVALFDDFLGKETGEGVTIYGAAPKRMQPFHYVVRDTEHKGLHLRDGRLVATSLQGANATQEEPISVVPNRHLERQRTPLIVGIRGGSQALSCGTGPQPRLQLEEVELLELFHAGQEAAMPYTFYKTFGGTTHTFEAAAFPGLFLSTAPRPGEELGLAPGDAPGAITSFYLHRK